MVDNPLNPFPGDPAVPGSGDMIPILTLDSLPQTRDVERNHFRFVTGLRGDLGDSTWSYEGFYSYDRGIGFQAQPILFENHLVNATQKVRMSPLGLVGGATAPNCNWINPTIGLGHFDTLQSCVPVDWNNPDLYTGGPNGEGVFTDAEAAYLIGNRTNRTVVEQSMIGAFVTGDLFEFNGQTVAAAFGAEFREDEISSQNDITGVMGLNAAENPLQEGSTIGKRDVTEIYGEISWPILDNLNFDAAVRYTDESNFGEETTWRARISWSPLDYLTLSGSAGTSFRAPNLREQFLAGQGGGVSGSLDPCIDNNIQALDASDPLTQHIIQNCIASGIIFTDENGDGQPDTTVLGTQGVTTIPTTTSGQGTLVAETSDAYTATIQFSQPGSGEYDLDVALSYWSIDIENTVEELTPEYIIDECYRNQDFPDYSSGFCNLITRPGDSPAGNIISSIDISFINIGQQTAKGLDLNTRLLWPIDRWGTDIAWATATTKQLEQEVQIFDPTDRDDNLGGIGTPEYKFTSTRSFVKDDWEVLLQNRFYGDGQQDNSEAPRANPFLAGDWGTQPNSRDVDWVDSTWYTDLSVTYFTDTWSASVGINNLFDEDPPLIDASEGPNRNNAVSSSGYDFFGRTWFATFSMAF